MATSKKKAEKKAIAPKWYVEELHSGTKTFYAAAQMVGDQQILKGGYWTTRAEAEKVAERLNMEEMEEKLP